MNSPNRTSTPERILEAARILFAERGYERTTIRGIGATVGVDPALIVHYFGGKEGLFAKVAMSGLEVPDLSRMDGTSVGACLVSYLVDAMERRVDGLILTALLRASVSHEGALRTLQVILQKRLQRALAEVLPPNEADLRSGLIATQMMGLVMTRYILKLPSVACLPKEDVVKRVGPVIQHYLFSHMADGIEPANVGHGCEP